MFGLMKAFLGRMRYRRRWSRLAAAASATADSATADLNRRRRSRNDERQPDAQATDGRPARPFRFPSSRA
jgi:hypothetical protein